MQKSKDIQDLAGAVKDLFEKRLGSFRTQDFAAVARELGIQSISSTESGDTPNFTYHSQQQPGEGFWAAAPGAGDISEGMVWVSTE
jgi:hypothetical protein